MKENHPIVENDSAIEDFLQGPESFVRFDQPWNSLENKLFYNGGSFDSKAVRDLAKTTDDVVNTLASQIRYEKFRYFADHGHSLEGYLPRFVFGENLAHVFEIAANGVLPSSKRPPVGLNPERFIGTCQSCGCWLHGCEYGTTLCGECK